MPVTIPEEETQKHLWNVTQGQSLASYVAARSPLCSKLQDSVGKPTGKHPRKNKRLLEKSESYGRGQSAGH